MKFRTKKSTISTWLLLSFLMILTISAFISEFFQAPTFTTHQFTKYTLLLDGNKLANVRGLSLKNHLGNFQMEKDPSGTWYLTSPRQLAANPKLINEILKSLEQINIKKVYSRDPINIANFSLQTPLITLTLKYAEEEDDVLRFGLINPIDNSTYIMVSERAAIYHTTTQKMALETLELIHFIDSRIFPQEPSNITELKILKGAQKDNNLRIQFIKKDNLWVDRRGQELDQEKALAFINELISIKSEIILDKMDEKLTQSLERNFKAPQYTIELTDDNEQQITYVISGIIGTLPGIKLEKWQNFAITASNRTHPYIVKRAVLNIFNKSQTNFRPPPIKKLFY